MATSDRADAIVQQQSAMKPAGLPKDDPPLAPAVRDPKAHVESAAKIVVLGLGLAYATGYLVVMTYLDRYGIRETGGDFFKLKYIYVGGLCLAMPTALATAVLGLTLAKRTYVQDAPRRSWREILTDTFNPPAPAARAPGQQAESLHWTTMVVFGTMLAVSYCIIAFSHPGFYAARVYLVYSLYACILVVTLLRPILGNRAYSARANVVRAVLAFVTLGLGSATLWGIGLASLWADGGYGYGFLVLLVAFLVRRFMAPMPDMDARERLGRVAIRVALLGSILILSIFSFAHTVYCHIPAEKGGGDLTQMPDSRVCFLESHKDSIPVGLLADLNQQPVCTVRVKIIEETPTSIYLARSSDRGKYSQKNYPNAAVLWRSGLYRPVVFNVNRLAIASIVTLNQGETELSVRRPELTPPLVLPTQETTVMTRKTRRKQAVSAPLASVNRGP
ncbi:MAG: hypothetical protein ABSD56_04315 [Bryobacteraceae bacterium]